MKRIALQPRRLNGHCDTSSGREQAATESVFRASSVSYSVRPSHHSRKDKRSHHRKQRFTKSCVPGGGDQLHRIVFGTVHEPLGEGLSFPSKLTQQLALHLRLGRTQSSESFSKLLLSLCSGVFELSFRRTSGLEGLQSRDPQLFWGGPLTTSNLSGASAKLF